ALLHRACLDRNFETLGAHLRLRGLAKEAVWISSDSVHRSTVVRLLTALFISLGGLTGIVGVGERFALAGGILAVLAVVIRVALRVGFTERIVDRRQRGFVFAGIVTLELAGLLSSMRVAAGIRTAMIRRIESRPIVRQPECQA